ncbi:MAG: GGDEF domain-containing protein [Steroidobacteraceae bacterium]
MAKLSDRLGLMLLGPLAHEPAVVRERMLATVLQSRTSLIITSSSLLLITLTAALVSGARWTWAWALCSSVIVLWRLLYPVLATRHGATTRLVNIMVASALLFVIFGVGCALAIRSRNLALVTMSLSATIGIAAGLSSRWAAVPRAAISTMTLISLPPVAALVTLGGAHLVAAFATALVITSISAFTLQNHRNLLAGISAEEHSAQLARTDALTGLHNRAELTRRLESACAALTAAPASRLQRFALLYLDLDGFKSVNDGFGHAAGDSLLRSVADGLREVVGPDHTIARIGGDEFVVLLREVGEADARTMADRIIDRITRDHVLAEEGHRVRVGCSVGMSLAPLQGREPALLMARADAALYAVKNQGKGQSGLWRSLG